MSKSHQKQVKMRTDEEVGQKAVPALQFADTEWDFWLPTLEEAYEECSFDPKSLRKRTYEETLGRHASGGGVDGMYVYNRPRSRSTTEGEKGSMMINYYKDESGKTIRIVAIQIGLYQKDDSKKFRTATRTSITWAASETENYSTFMEMEIIEGRHSVTRWPKGAYKFAPEKYPISTLELSQTVSKRQKHAYRKAQNDDVAKELEENEQYILASHRRNKILAEQLIESKKKTSEANDLKKKHNATNTKLRAENKDIKAENKDLKAQLQRHLNSANDVERLRDELLGTQEAFDELKRQYNELLELDDASVKKPKTKGRKATTKKAAPKKAEFIEAEADCETSEIQNAASSADVNDLERGNPELSESEDEVGEAEDAPTRKSAPSTPLTDGEAPPSRNSSFSTVQSVEGDVDMEDAAETMTEKPESVTSDSDMSDRSKEDATITEAEETSSNIEATLVADESQTMARSTTGGKSVGGKRAVPKGDEDIDERPTARKTVAGKFPQKSVPVREATPDMTPTDEPSCGDGGSSPLEAEVEQGARSPLTVDSPARERETSPAPAASDCPENAAGNESPVSQPGAADADAPAPEDGRTSERSELEDRRTPERCELEDAAQTQELDEKTVDTAIEESPIKSAGDAGEKTPLDEPPEKASSQCEFVAEPECIDARREGSSTPCPEAGEVTESTPAAPEIVVTEASEAHQPDESKDEASDCNIHGDEEEERQRSNSPEPADLSSGTSPGSSPETSKKRPRSSIGDGEDSNCGESAAKKPRLGEERSADEEMAEARSE